MMWLIGAVVVVSLVGGVAAALVGRGLVDPGSGAGGLFGMPSTLLTLIALVLGVPAAVMVARAVRPGDGWVGAAVIVGAGAWIVAIGYFVVAHAVDPCLNGWWDGRSRIGSQPLCERFGPELNWHTRFHLLAHAAPAAGLFAIYFWAVRRSLSGRRGAARDVLLT
ncbi:MAG: hypothetical protein P8J50_03945 [Acidimicrobiales bacterium]|jgi:hypothetical protein|nr:hypothetical protein [Acidimicrobiales bacterium]